MYLCLHCFDTASFSFSTHQVAVTEAQVTTANVQNRAKTYEAPVMYPLYTTTYFSFKYTCKFLCVKTIIRPPVRYF
jgi:hypothetical protein